MKKILTAVLMVCSLCGCQSIKDYVKKIDLPPISTTTTTIPASTSCGCDLSTAYQIPPYDKDELDAGGNKYECPQIAGRDVRLSCARPNTTPWLLGNLLPKAVSFDGGKMESHCFDADGGRYHVTHYSRKGNGDDKVATKSGDWFAYQTTTFVWYEWRARK
jgi:hypothetical protein